jgi:YD repeat-containing protein
VSASYNGAEELTAYSDPSANMTSATYDGNGLRSTDTVGSSTEGFVWDERGSVPELLMDGTNAYLYAGGTAPSEQVNLSSGAVSYLVADALGPVRAVLSSTGALSASTAYDVGQPRGLRWAPQLHAVRLRRRLHRPERARLPDPSLLRPSDGAIRLGRPPGNRQPQPVRLRIR